MNKCVFNNKFKLEDFNSAIKYCNENDFMFKFDLKSDYHDLDINTSNFQNLCFCWKMYITLLQFFRVAWVQLRLFLRSYLSHWSNIGDRRVKK